MTTNSFTARTHLSVDDQTYEIYRIDRFKGAGTGRRYHSDQGTGPAPGFGDHRPHFPAGSISQNSPAGQYLIEQGVEPADYNSYGSRRGNHNVMIRGTFANVRLRNQLVPGVEGGFTRHWTVGVQQSIFDAATAYASQCVQLAGEVSVRIAVNGTTREFAATLRIDTPAREGYYRHGGILPYVLRHLVEH